MKQQSPADQAAEKVLAALRQTEAENSHLQGMIAAFRGTLIEQARWKAELPAFNCEEIGPPDPAKFAEGMPLTGREHLIHLGEMWQTAAERLLPSMAAGFPKIREDLEWLQAAIMDGGLVPDLFLSAAFGGRKHEALEIAGHIDFEPVLLEFVLTQLGKPVAEKRAEVLQPLIKNLTWHKGYCPICGSLPTLSLLKEKEGQRWLRCGFCASTWRFQRTCCPFCDTEELGDRETFFVEGREHERVEVCHRCKRYIPSIDLRNLANEVVLEAAGFGLMHLDAIAQEKGFVPAAALAWNITGGEDKSFTPVMAGDPRGVN